MKWLSLNESGLPGYIVKVLSRRGITSLNPAQVTALESGLLQWKNMLITSPTASGKTLIAEIGMVTHIKERGGKAVYVTPLRALASEKAREFKDWEEIGLKVGLTSGEYDTDDAYLKDYDIIVTTYEKLDSLYRHRAAWLKDVNYFVLDELHYMGDSDRGGVIESVAIRAKRSGSVLALSATVGNAEEIAKWLRAVLVSVAWRPVPLREAVMYKSGKQVVLEYKDGEVRRIYGDDPVITYALDVIYKGGQVLIFRSSRRYAETLAFKLAERTAFVKLEKNELEKVKERILELEDSGTEEKETMASLVMKGVAYHHAGLSRGMREIIEDSFRRRLLKAIVATPTLAAGVNLPARAVIIADISRFNRRVLGYREEISVTEYRQMAGRAGRPGFDKEGEAVVFVRDSDELEYVKSKFWKSEVEPIQSRLGSEASFYSFILSILSSEGKLQKEDLLKIASESLLPHVLVKKYLNEGLEWLEDHGFIRVVDNEVSLTKLGSRVSDLYLNPFSANVLKEALENADENCELAYLHAMAYTPDGPVVAVSKAEEDEMLDELDCDLLIGEPYDEVEMENYLSALKVAFITRDWIEEKEEDYILKKYSIGSGDLRTIIDAMDWLSYSTYHLAKVLEMDDKLDFLMKLHERVAEGVKEELLGLVKIKGIGRKRARLLYNAGIRKPEDIVMNPEKVKSLLGEKLGEQIVRRAGEFLSNLAR
ncbi:MAG: DEAD/DEAH box helicase [Sulfolobales archaeon]|nr:DEAD/DEAH box helicase [Sulfolobales archaeon]MCG2893619.1 DEAD/DEAH box helicase [Sulfolobales archaeon]